MRELELKYGCNPNQKPARIFMESGELADLVWDSLNADNKVSLFVRYIDLATGTWESVIKNKHQ